MKNLLINIIRVRSRNRFIARDLQSDLNLKGYHGKRLQAFDGSAVVGNWINKTEFNNVNDLEFSLEKNGNVVQQVQQL